MATAACWRSYLYRKPSSTYLHVRLDSRNPAIRMWPETRGPTRPPPGPLCPAAGPAPAISPARQTPLTCPSSFLEQPKFQATLPANSAATLRHSFRRHLSRVESGSVGGLFFLLPSPHWRGVNGDVDIRHSVACSRRLRESGPQLCCAKSHHTASGFNTMLSPSVVQPHNHPTAVCDPDFLRLPGAGGGIRQGGGLLSTGTEDTATSASIQASTSPRPSRFGRPVDRLLPALRPRSVVVAQVGQRSGCTSDTL